MKTQKIALRGEEFMFTDSAERTLRDYLKELERATLVQKVAYLQCTEALRDVLLERPDHSSNVTQRDMKNAINIVGVPPVTSENIFASVKLMLHDAWIWAAHFKGGWRRIGHVISVAVAFVAVFAGLFVGATAILLVIIAARAQAGWYQEFSYGIVRMPWVGSFPPMGFVLLVAVLLFVSGICLTLHAYWLLRKRHGWWPWIGVVIGSVLAVGTGMGLINHNEPISYTHVNRYYLQECGTEIPIYLPESDPFPTYRQLTNEGYRLAATIPTNHETMQMDTAVLCKEYRALREKTASDPVLQLYKTAADGSALPYDQFQDTAANWSFGLFTKS